MKKGKAKVSKTQKAPISPLGDRVLIKELKERETQGKTDSGIYLPETVKEDRGAKKGEVVAVGEGRYEDGKLVPISVKVGDKVLFQWGDNFSFKGEEYTVVRESEIIAIIS